MTTGLYEACYNIYGYVAVYIVTHNARHIQKYDILFRHFKTGNGDAEQVYRIFDYSSFQMPPDRFHDQDGLVEFDSGFCSPDTRYAVTIDTCGIMEFTDRPENMTVMFWLLYLLQRNEMTFLHGAALGLDGECIVFPGFSGCGKTLLALLLKDRPDYSFFSDELTIIRADGTIYAYPSDLNISLLHTDLLPGLLPTENRTYLKRREMDLNRIRYLEKVPCPSFLQPMKNAGISSLKRHNVAPIHLKMPASQIFPQEKLGTILKVTTAVLLTRYNGPDMQIEKIDLPVYIKKVTTITNFEFRGSRHILHAVSAGSSVEGLSFLQRQRDILQRASSGVELYEARIPHAIGPAVFADEIARFLESTGK
jgi:hypothetical protein